MPYLKIPFSYQFLTQMSVAVYKVTDPQWQNMPYTDQTISSILRLEAFRKDASRTVWHFGGRQRDNEAKSQEDVFKREAGLYVVSSEELSQANSIEEICKSKLSQAANNHHLQLSLEEAGALWAFACSVGNGEFLQGGAIRGTGGFCANATWFGSTLNLWIQRYYEEGQRVERLSDQSLKIACHYECDQLTQELGNSDTQHLYKFSSEFRLAQERDQKGRRVFTLIPQQQALAVNNTLWDAILVAARKKLETETNFLIWCFACIPCLCDENFRKDFCEKLVKLPHHEYEYGIKWIRICYQGQERDEELNTILDFLRQQRRLVMANRPWLTRFINGCKNLFGNIIKSLKALASLFSPSPLGPSPAAAQRSTIRVIEAVKQTFRGHAVQVAETENAPKARSQAAKNAYGLLWPKPNQHRHLQENSRKATGIKKNKSKRQSPAH